MKTAKTHLKTHLLGVAALLCLAPLAARADHKEVQGRTGLPAVKEGKESVWMERGIITLDVQGNDLVTTQEFKLHYPSGKIAKGDQVAKVAIREDYFRSNDNGAGDITESDSKGFSKFDVIIDDQPITTNTGMWIINEKKDTATRWRNWRIDFTPGDVHTMKVVSVAPLGWDGNHRTVQFIGKDIGGWRTKPDYLEITLKTPNMPEARLIDLQPKPVNQTPNVVRWIYRKADPNRDILISLPSDYKP
jgi:hypothetical protein